MSAVADPLLAQVLAETTDGVIAVDRELRYTLWNAAMERIAGVAAIDVLGKPAAEAFPFLVETGELRLLQAALAGEHVESHVQRYDVPATGRHGLFQARYTPRRDASGNIIGALGIVREMTAWEAAREHEAAMASATAALALSSERLALALEAARLGPWEWEIATDVVTFSERAAEIFGIAAGPGLTWTAMRDMIHPEDRDVARTAVERSVADRTDYDVEYRIRRPGGREVWVAANGRAMYDEAGAPVRMLGVVQDISARKYVEQALVDEMRASAVVDRVGKLLLAELELDKLLQALTDAATELCDAQFGSFFYNVVDGKGESYMLYTLSGVPRDAFSQFPMPRKTAVFAPTFDGVGVVRSDDITRDPRYGHSEPHFGMPAGHLPVRSYLAIPVTARSGETLGGLFFGHERAGVFTPRHERILSGIASQAAIAIDNARLFQQANAATREARERAAALAEADRHKDDFLAMLAHELRNPLGAVNNAIHVLSRSKPHDASFERAIQIAMRQIDHQRKLVDDLLDVSRIARGKVHIHRVAVDLAALVRDTCEDHRPAIENGGIALAVEVPPEPLVVEGDSVRLAQVLGNLLDNARKFTRKGGRITVRVEARPDAVAIDVSDTGIGMEPASIPKLFMPFAQADRSIDRTQGGLGLGLALAKGLVELHGGSIDAHSDGLDRGTRVSLTLPRPADVQRTTAPRPAIAHAHQAHVLVIDDLRDAADMLRDLLEIMGCTVDVAYDARSGIAAMRARRPDVILCDLGLPDMNGYELARVVRAEAEAANIRLVALTGYGAESDQRASAEAGFSMHLTKPIRIEQLEEVLGRSK